jgi:dihydrodiol dehydrogenase / D-xylose 1-dehydrogenase (NADP)
VYVYRKKEVGGGSILDLGVYTLHLVDAIFGPGKPEFVVSKGVMNSHGTDENVSAILTYSEGRIAVVSTHTKVKLNCSAFIYGTNGMITVIPNRNRLLTGGISHSTAKTLLLNKSRTC